MPPAGEALKGIVGAGVNVENVSPVDIQSWQINLVDVPPGSGVPTGVLAAADTNTPLAAFIPDAVPGCYRIQLFVWPQPGQVGTPDEDIRNFAVPEPIHGHVFPPYQELPPKLPVLGSGFLGEKPDELNFGGQPYGWAGTGLDGLLLEQLRKYTLNSTDTINFSYNEIPMSGITLPEGQVLYQELPITGPGILKVNGLLKSPGLPPRRVRIAPPQLTGDAFSYNPSGFSPATDVVLTADGPHSIHGMHGLPMVRSKKLINDGANPIQLEDQSPSSVSYERFELPGGLPLVLGSGDVREAFRDGPALRWRVQ